MNCFHRQQLTVVWKNERNWVPLARKSVTLVKTCSFFYNWFPLDPVTSFHLEEKPLKKEMFPLAGKSVSTSENEGLIEINVSSRRKKPHYLLIALMISNSIKNSSNQKNTVSVGNKSVCISRIEDIEKKTLPLYGSTASTLKKTGKIEKNWCPLAGIWFVFKIWLPSNFSNIFH